MKRILILLSLLPAVAMGGTHLQTSDATDCASGVSRFKASTGKFECVTLPATSCELTWTGSAFACKTGTSVDPAAPLLAFPGCEGAGCGTRGGFDTSTGTPTIYRVTSLASGTGAGTLGACIAASGPRVCVFAVAGVISRPAYTISNPYITIRGDTAPGMGVELDNNGQAAADVLQVRARNVVIRGLRFRDGNVGSATDDDSHAINVYGSGAAGLSGLVFDHVSTSWGNDEVFSFLASSTGGYIKNVTVSYSIISEGLVKVSPAGETRGTLIASYEPYSQSTTDIDFHHNYFANNVKRNPEVTVKTFRFVNNILYNWQNDGVSAYNASAEDLINNIGRPGPNTVTSTHPMMSPLGFFDGSRGPATGDQALYVSGNKYCTGADAPTCEAVKGWGTDILGISGGAPAGQPVHRATPLPAPTIGTAITADLADNLPTTVLGAGGAGHSRRLDCGGAWVNTGVRDAVDTRLVNSFFDPPPSYTYPTTPADVGGFPTITQVLSSSVCASNSRDNTSCTCADSDSDGIPDYWELAFCGTTTACQPLATTVSAPWTNLEAFMSGQKAAP